MPCLNEADTLATCIRKARRAMAEHGIDGEIIIADNGSTDGSHRDCRIARGARRAGRREGLRQRPARRHPGGARQIRPDGRRRRQLRLSRNAQVRRPAARRPRARARLPTAQRRRHGACRAPCRRRIAGSATRCSRWLVRRMFAAPIHDVYCGLRGFTRELYDELDLPLDRHGVRHRDDHQEQPVRRRHRRSADDAASRRPQGRTRRTCAPCATAGGRCGSS